MYEDRERDSERHFKGLALVPVGAGKTKIRRAGSKLEIPARVDVVV
jgi:hypothetical protein